MLQLFKNLITLVKPLIIVSIIVASCSHPTTPDLSVVKDTVRTKPETIIVKETSSYKITKSTFEDFDTLKQNIVANFSSDTSAVKKLNGKFELKLNNGQIKIFRDSVNEADEVSNIEYTYLGYYSNPNFHLVNTSGWEWGSYDLVPFDKDTIISFSETPKFSENGRYAASICFTFLGDFSNRIELVDVKDNYKRVVDEKNDSIVAFNFYWDKNELFILAKGIKEYLNESDKYASAKPYCLRVKIK